MQTRFIAKCLVLALIFAIFPLRAKINKFGYFTLGVAYVYAKSGSDNDRDDGENRSVDDYGVDRDREDISDRAREYDAPKKRSKGTRPVSVQKLQNGARVIYSDGSRDEIKAGSFVRTDGNGNVIESRRALASDLARMRTLFHNTGTINSLGESGVDSRAVKATFRGRNVDVLYANGWRETITSGHYALIDKYGRVVISRNVSQDDRFRLNRFRN